MYGALQSGGRSPKPLNGPTGTPHLRPGSESVHNSNSPLSSQAKGKKRDRGNHSSDSVKRERVSRTDDTDFGQFRPEHILKSEISKITDRGGLVDFGGVEKFVKLMQPGKIDLACRLILVDVLAVTDSFDCLGWFLQFRGLPVLDEWLQEVNKGKIGGGSSPKESDKSVDEFLFVLLRALDKLPINLNSLQTCNIGKSVNHLRSHKNSEIQKKARSLVDTWKKRVEAEMNIIDAKSGSSRGVSWPSKSVLLEVSHMGTQSNGESSGAAQSSACKTPVVRLGSGEAVAKIASASTGLTKSSASMNISSGDSGKNLHSTTLVGGGSSDLPLSTVKEEKSSCSSQSQNNSQSSSSDHAKNGGTCKEDARSLTVWSVNMTNISGCASRHQKLSNVLQRSAVSGIQKVPSSGKFSSLGSNMASEKMSFTRGTPERVPDVPIMDHGNSQRLVVRLPNTGRSPRSANGGSFEETTTTFKVCPAHSEKLDHHDRKVKGKSDALRASGGSSNINMDICQGRDGLVRSNEGNKSSPGAPCNEHSRTTEDVEKLTEVSKGTASSSAVTTKQGKSYDASFSSMNALIESCAKFSVASPTALGGDNIGMNLLASVAAGELSRSDVSPSGSPWRKSPKLEGSCSETDMKLRHLDDSTAQSERRPDDGAKDGAMAEQGNSVSLLVKNESQHDVIPLSTHYSGNSKTTSFFCEEKTGACIGQLTSSINLQQNAHRSYVRSNGKPGQVNDASVLISSEDATKEEKVEGEGAGQLHVPRKSCAGCVRVKSLSTSKLKERSTVSDVDKVVDCAGENVVESSMVMFPEADGSLKVEKEGNIESPSCSSSEMGREDKSSVHRESDGILTELKTPIKTIIRLEEGTAPPSGSIDVLCMEAKTEKANEMEAVSWTGQSEKQNIDVSSSNLVKNEECVEKSKIKEVSDQCPDGSTNHEEPSTISVQRTGQGVKYSGKLCGIEACGTEECSSSAIASSDPATGPDTAVQLDFDLNEGFPVDDGFQRELTKSFPASITVASAAKGSFLPPENPLRSKGELGWKGSAATSAFRPAEPRKVLEMPHTTDCSPVNNNIISKQGRPPLDIDLNVTDHTDLEDVASWSSAQETCLESWPLDCHGGGLDLDLNRADECPDVERFSVGNSRKLEISQLSSRSSLPGGFSHFGLNTSRDFDLNNGPGPDDGATDMASCAKGNVPFLSPIPGVRMNTVEQGNFSSWFPPSNSYSAIVIPSILPGRGEQSYPIVPAIGSLRILAPAGGTSFGPEFYRGPVLPSSPAVPFSPAAPFQYAGFPFATNFPLSSNLYSGCSTAYDSSSGRPLYFPSVPSQLLGPSGVVSSHDPRPYMMNLPGGTSNVGPETRRWGGMALDLNTGPRATDVERRDERLSSSLRHLPIIGSQVSADEQLKMYQMEGVALKRKEPDGGWDGDRISYKQPSWQ
ncbi:protein SUO [Actinidia rufa]|uniref:Protein SUO n=1 Tax=Actinidia rufa TaxID=165716 RepID=A0A7J0DJI8_9ERIC|nr:protein SUO [Actinidia rufa]